MGWIADIGNLGESLFGKDTETNTQEFGSQLSNVRADVSGVGTKQLQLDPAAIQQIIRDVLGADDGLAAIFSAENQAGVFNSSVAQQATGDLVSNIIGELAKVTGKEVSTEDRSQEQRESTESSQSTNILEGSSGLLEKSGLNKLSRELDPTGSVEFVQPEPDSFADKTTANRESILGKDEDTGDEDSSNPIDPNTAKSDEMAAKITDIVMQAFAGG